MAVPPIPGYGQYVRKRAARKAATTYHDRDETPRIHRTTRGARGPRVGPYGRNPMNQGGYEGMHRQPGRHFTSPRYRPRNQRN